MACDWLDDAIEAVAGGERALTAVEQAHVIGCDGCTRSLELARAIHATLGAIGEPRVPADFTSAVMMRIGEGRWQIERAVDLGFNLALAAGAVIIVSSLLGLAWASGLLSVTIELGPAMDLIRETVTTRFPAAEQTFVLAVALLVMAVGLWWWSESDLTA